MNLTFLGVSSALSVGDKQFNSNMLITNSFGQNILIDCGSDIKHSLYYLGLSHVDIHAIYVSHLHADHVGGLEWLAFAKYFIERKKPKLYISADQKDKLWDQVLSGGLTSLEDYEANLNSYFEVEAVVKQFSWESYLFQLVKTSHVSSNHKILPSYGLLIKGDKEKIFISTDSKPLYDTQMNIYQEAGIIFHDCEINEIKSGVHAHYEELCTLNPQIKEKMWLYNYNNDETLPNAKQDGFKGFVTRGQQFSF